MNSVITFKQLFSKIYYLAKALTEIGVKEGDSVAISTLAIPEGVISFFATNYIGATANMINVFSGGDREIEEQMRKFNSKVLITQDIFYNKRIRNIMDKVGVTNVVTTGLADSLPIALNMDKAKFEIVEFLKSFGNQASKDNRCIRFNDMLNVGREAQMDIRPKYTPDKIAMVAYTSGSTGEPKAVAATNEAAVSMKYLMGLSVDNFAPKDIMFSTLPLWIYYELINSIFDPLALGAAVALDPLFDAKKVEKKFSQYHFNHWNSITPDIIEMTKNKKMKDFDLSFLKSISIGGASIDPEHREKARTFLRERNSDVEIWDGYGTSETLGCIFLDNKPLEGNIYKIVNIETKEIVPEGKVGELYVLTPSLMKCYYGNEKLTNSTLEIDKDGYVWFKTGDLFHEYRDKDNILKVKDNITIERNAYFKDNDYLYVQNTNNFISKNYNDTLNIIYSIINSGVSSFTFYCDIKYNSCIQDVESILDNEYILSTIKNYVHPYNSFDVINTRYDKYGKITLSITKAYNEEQIKLIENKVNEIINNNINSSMNDIEKIKVIHDYIINNANYDTSLEKLKYSKADDVLLYKRGICSSYTDAMSIFLNRFNINNYKIASEEHIWNLVYLNNNWLHLDLTWDDPVNENGKDILDYNYYLITTKKLKEIDNSKSHRFNKDFYLELKES